MKTKKAIIKTIIFLVVVAVLFFVGFFGYKFIQLEQSKKLGDIMAFVFTEKTDTEENRFSFDVRTMKAVSQTKQGTTADTVVIEYDWTQTEVTRITELMAQLGVNRWEQSYKSQNSLVQGGSVWELSVTYQNETNIKSSGDHFTPQNYNQLIMLIQEMFPRQLVAGDDYNI